MAKDDARFRTYYEKYDLLEKPKGRVAFVIGTFIFIGLHWHYTQKAHKHVEITTLDSLAAWFSKFHPYK